MGDCSWDLRDHFVAQKLESFEDVDCDPVVCVDVECLNYVAKTHSCLKPEHGFRSQDDNHCNNEVTTNPDKKMTKTGQRK